MGEPDAAPESEEQGGRFFSRLRDSLSKSRRALTGELVAATSFDPGDDADWERLEEALIAGDVGVRATAELVRRLEARGELPDLNVALAEEVTELFGAAPVLDVAHEPAVILVVGVNGTGKTTTIGKLSARLAEHGRSVVVVLVGEDRSRGHDAVEAAVARGRDVVVVDTAGRLHTQTNLMEELAKVRRVIGGRLEGAPHETLLVVDATTGQNGVQQARLFGDAVGVTGVVLTKLDGSAKGGVAIPIAYELGLPVKLVGVGEALEDLQPFDPRAYAQALVAG